MFILSGHMRIKYYLKITEIVKYVTIKIYDFKCVLLKATGHQWKFILLTEHQGCKIKDFALNLIMRLSINFKMINAHLAWNI